MSRAIFTVVALLWIGVEKGYAMELNNALKLVQAWGQDSKDMRLIGQMKVDATGGFLTQSAGAVFRYEPSTKRLLVSGLVRYEIKSYSKYPRKWQLLVRASKREWATLGEGEMELYTHKLFHLEPDVVLLTKVFCDDGIAPAQFVKEVDWLLRWAHYWFMKRQNQVFGSTEAELERQGPLINEQMLREQPRPW